MNLERTNVADAPRALGGAEIDLVAVELSYLSLARAVPQLDGVRRRPDADLVALVKPM